MRLYDLMGPAICVTFLGPAVLLAVSVFSGRGFDRRFLGRGLLATSLIPLLPLIDGLATRKVDGMELMFIQAIMLPQLALAVACLSWAALPGKGTAKFIVAFVVAMMVVPGTCFGSVAVAEQVGWLRSWHP